ncbi:methyltransferase domain protein [Clostridiales bacterium oral taxon 876 str. F0540]|nr:methyltransferase domain protein [Clostridiales bacterium oral taxon 876 str. F0540]
MCFLETNVKNDIAFIIVRFITLVKGIYAILFVWLFCFIKQVFSNAEIDVRKLVFFASFILLRNKFKLREGFIMSSQETVKYEEMSSFFNERAEGYEAHMRETVNSFETYYDLISCSIEETDKEVEILDLGCGTGLEIEGIFKKAPNARITCIDMSEQMLEILLEKYKSKKGQINIIKDSYLSHSFGVKRYDYVISVMTMHHFVYDEKKRLYEKIRSAVKDGGRYIEGDYVVSQENEEKWLKEYYEAYEKYGLEASKLYHIDIPFSIETQKRLLKEAGFTEFELVFKEGEHTIYFAE